MSDVPPQTSLDPIHGIELAPGVLAVPPSALRIKYARSSGPGGQNVNKVNTKAELWIAVTALSGLKPAAAARLRVLAGNRLTRNDEIHLTGEESRSQEGNRLLILERLREIIVRAKVEPKVRKKTKRTRGAQLRRLDSKKRRGEIKSQRRGAFD
jgi:ribosome-associated protein